MALAQLHAALRTAAAAAAARASPTTVRLQPAAFDSFLSSVARRLDDDDTDEASARLPTHAGQWKLIEVSKACAHLLPSVLHDAIGRIYRADSAPCVLVSGVPMPSQPHSVTTPLLHKMSEAAAADFRATLAVQAAIGSLAGGQYTFIEEREDNAFHFVMPAPGVPADSQSSVGTSAVNFHTEDPITPIDVFQPRALTLLMVRPQPGAETALAPVDALSSDLLADPELWATLAEPRFSHPSPDIVRIMGGDRTHDAEDAYAPTKGRPVLYTRSDPRGGEDPVASICLVEQTDALDSEDAKARDAVARLRELLLRRATRHDLDAGEMLVWANQRVAHGRTGSLDPSYEGFDRLLVRTFHHPSPPALVVRDYESAGGTVAAADV